MTPKRKGQEIDPKVHWRILKFINAARRPRELLELPHNWFRPLIDPEHRYKAPEHGFREKEAGPELLSTPDDKYFYPTYPGLHPLPEGDIFYAPVGFRSSQESLGACPANEDSVYLNMAGALTGAWHDVGPNDRTKGMSVLLLSPTHPCVRVLTVGGGDLATAKTYQMIDLSTPSPTRWTR